MSFSFLLQLEKHLSVKFGDCPLSDISCPYNVYGCSFAVSIVCKIIDVCVLAYVICFYLACFYFHSCNSAVCVVVMVNYLTVICGSYVCFCGCYYSQLEEI